MRSQGRWNLAQFRWGVGPIGSALLSMVATIGLLALSPEVALGAAPSLERVLPRGVERGKETTIVLQGKRLSDAREVLFYRGGFEVISLEPAAKGAEVKVTVRVAPDCVLGEHPLRLRTATGITELRTIYVGALPSVEEKEPNGEFASPQAISLNVTVAGVIENEDVDHFSLEATKGQRISAEVEGMRLGDALFDPYVAILDARRFELASSDDTPLLRQDPFCQVIAPENGTYVIQVRESAYGGNGNCRYRLHVGTFPRPTAVFPPGGRAGEDVEVTFLGDVSGPMVTKIPALAAELPGGGLFATDSGGISPSAVPFRVGELVNVNEVEPNDDQGTATAARAPAAFCGVLSKAGDADFFRFQATKGQVLDIHVYARRIRSPLDSVLEVYHLGGGRIAANDDSAGPDSYLRFTAPEAKEYALRITDHLGRGGPDHTYRVEVTPVVPRLQLSIPPVAQYSQERQAVAVPKGNRYTALVAVNRQDFGGDLTVDAADLPAGVTFSCENVIASLNVVPVLFEAAGDAAVAGRLSQLRGRHADPEKKIAGGFQQVVELVRGEPGQAVYWSSAVDRLAVAVTEEAPFRLRIEEPKVPLVQNGTMDLRVVAERKDGCNAPIQLEMVFQPPGVSAARGVKIPEGQTSAEIRLNANARAPTRAWKVAVNGRATVGDGPVWVSTQLATLQVAPPCISLELAKASAEQGEAVAIHCKVEHHSPFQGTAKAELVGLPNRVSAEGVEITPETKEFSFQVKIDEKSPPGQHRNLFCSVAVPGDGGVMVFSTGGTELRIDKPPPPKETSTPQVAKKTPSKPTAPKEANEKPLSRLEKLRREYAGDKENGS